MDNFPPVCQLTAEYRLNHDKATSTETVLHKRLLQLIVFTGQHYRV